jgi:ABC-type nitrate/sulfonate/bicarbonate transport system substrate-binding protein
MPRKGIRMRSGTSSRSGTQGSETKLKIVVFESPIFLYLPLHYARQKNWFNFLPPGYDIDITSSVGKTDKSCFDMLMSEKSTYANIAFALADPTAILDHAPFGGQRRPAVIASMITNTAFWAVNHGALRSRDAFDLAKFEKIITFGPGTTSYGIASGILRKSTRDVSSTIYHVDPKQELTTLLRETKGTVCLSPDILGIGEVLENNDGFEIELALGITPEFDNVLETALITRTDVLNEHGALVDALLKALQYALVMVRIQEPDVVQYANDYFRGKGEERVRSALNRAREANVYPTNIEVREASWMKAAEVAAHADAETFTPKKRQEARDVFDSTIAPYINRANEAVDAAYTALRGSLQVRDVGENRWNALEWSSCGVIASALVMTPVFAHWIDWAIVAVIGAVLGSAAASRKVVKPTLWKLTAYTLYSLCAILVILGSFTLYDMRYHGATEAVKIISPIVIAIILAIGGIVVAAELSRRHYSN